MQRAHPDTIAADPFAGPGVLSMLYANGEGVPRNTGLARRFVCENRWAASAELTARLQLLDTIDRAAAPPHFDLCATATSGLSEGACQVIASEKGDVSRSAQRAAFVRQLSPAGKQAFAVLQKADEAFASLHGSNEVDLSGTGRVAFEQQEEDATADQFLADLRSLRQPASSPGITPAQADAALNEAYAHLRRVLPATGGNPGSDFGTLNFADVQETERSWLRLRDQWMRFLAVAFPAYPHDAFLIRLTTERTKQLEAITQ